LEQNPVGLDGLEFIEFTGPNVQQLESLFQRLGLTEIAKHKDKNLRLFREGDINFVLNAEPGSFGEQFHKLHGPSVCATGFRVKDAKKAFETAVARGAKPFNGDSKAKAGWNMPAIYGIGDSLVYFVDQYPHDGGKENIYDGLFNYTTKDIYPKGKELLVIDHMTNNVPRGEMQKWCDFYEKVFNFTEKRFFDIRGKTTGLLSKVMRSPCGKFSIPINEPSDSKSQIQEYLDEYKGSGIQHIALLTKDICKTVKALNDDKIDFLDRPIATYYEQLPDRLPNMKEDIPALQKLGILADGDHEGYLLQIFTKNQVGPVFIEIIQRMNHHGFGDGNFQALFDAMEADQRARGVL
jgi:4-hydroxyphenylpyruvate dioxygenase